MGADEACGPGYQYAHLSMPSLSSCRTDAGRPFRGTEDSRRSREAVCGIDTFAGGDLGEEGTGAEEMEAIILAGGRAERLGEVAGGRPKSLVPLAGRPQCSFENWPVDERRPYALFIVPV